MKYTKIIALGILLVGMHTGSRAQIFQVFEKGLKTTKFQATDVDSLSHNDTDDLTTIHLKDGRKQSFQKAETDSIVWYDPTYSILSTLKQGYFMKYSNFLQLIKDCGNEYPNWRDCWSDYLNGATDLTVFAANDEAWQRFFAKNAKLPASNPWHTATSYDALTPDQKQTLLVSALMPDRKLSEMGKQGILRLKPFISADVWTPVLTPEYCALNSITEEDQRIICGAPITTPWMPGADITNADVVCTNGYLEEVSATLTPLATMADIIRNNGRTNIFAHIIDYIQQSQSEDPYGYSLKFDPSWAGYYDDRPVYAEKDMAAMFVPSDEAMWRFFTEGAGQVFLQTYFAQANVENPVPYVKPTTQGELFSLIDDVPTNVLSYFVNTIMMRSFAGSVPSKMQKLRDDAQEQLFYPEDIDKIESCLMACNGAIYIMDKVYGPADFTCVTAPAYASTTNKIINWAIYDQNRMGLNYYVYLKAPQQDITFFLPSDVAMAYYYDPVSMKSRTPRSIEMSYKNSSYGGVAVSCKSFNYYCPYNKNKGEVGTIGSQIAGSSGSINETDITNRLKDILLNHTIINDGTQDINSRNEYFRTFGGDVVKVIRDESGKIVGAKGTFQLENERNGIVSQASGATGCNVTASYESLSNGQTFTLDAPLVPTYRSLWSILTDDMMDSPYNGKEYSDEAWAANPYSEFYKLCAADAYTDAIIGCGLVDARMTTSEQKAAMKKYLVFTSNNGLDYNFAPLIGNTPYTAYIPTNEAVRKAIAQGLPTWEDIYKDFESHSSDGMVNNHEDSVRIANKIVTLTNVIKAHFHYNIAIADQEPFQEDYKSLAMDDNLVSRKLKVNSTGNGNMTVTDWNERTFNVLDNKNVFARDYTCNKSPRGVAMAGITIDGYRSCVIHQIDGVIGFK